MRLYVVVSGIILSMVFAPHFALANKCNEVFETEQVYELPTLGFIAKGYKQPATTDRIRALEIETPANEVSLQIIEDSKRKSLRINTVDLVASFDSRYNPPRTTLTLSQAGVVTYTDYLQGFRNIFRIPKSKAHQLIIDFNEWMTLDYEKNQIPLRKGVLNIFEINGFLNKFELIEKEVKKLSPSGDMLEFTKDSILWPKVELKALNPWDIKKTYSKTIEEKNDPGDAYTEMIGPIRVVVEPYGKRITVTTWRYSKEGVPLIDQVTTLNQFGKVSIEYSAYSSDRGVDSFSISTRESREVIIDIVNTLQKSEDQLNDALNDFPDRLREIKDNSNRNRSGYMGY